jgi:hypothetical protein
MTLSDRTCPIAPVRSHLSPGPCPIDQVHTGPELPAIRRGPPPTPPRPTRPGGPTPPPRAPWPSIPLAPQQAPVRTAGRPAR